MDFSKAVAFMSDTTNVMKGARSGVQKLIILLSMMLPFGRSHCQVWYEYTPDQLFVDISYFFFHSSKRKQGFVDLWCSLFTGEPEVI